MASFLEAIEGVASSADGLDSLEESLPGRTRLDSQTTLDFICIKSSDVCLVADTLDDAQWRQSAKPVRSGQRRGVAMLPCLRAVGVQRDHGRVMVFMRHPVALFLLADRTRQPPCTSEYD